MTPFVNPRSLSSSRRNETSQSAVNAGSISSLAGPTTDAGAAITEILEASTFVPPFRGDDVSFVRSARDGWPETIPTGDAPFFDAGSYVINAGSSS